MKALLLLILALFAKRADHVDPERLAAAIWASSQNRPRPPWEWSRLELTIVENETRGSQRIMEGRCRPLECDRGRAKGLGQLHRNALNRAEWAKQDGDVELQMALLARQLEAAYWQCAKSGVPWVQGTINAYAGRRCSDAGWPGLQQRLATYTRLR